MPRLLCHGAHPAPVEMTVAPGLEGLFACPVCGQRIQLVAEPNAPSEMDFNKLVASQGAESLAGRFGLVQEGAIYYTPAAETSEYVKFPELREFLHEYVRRYEAADAATFIELWAEDAVQDTDSLLLQQNQGQNSRVMILRNYSRLFHRIGPNRYQLTVTALSGDPTHFVVEGVYRIAYPAQADRPAYYAGAIHLEIGRNPDQPLKIQRLRFQPITFA